MASKSGDPQPIGLAAVALAFTESSAISDLAAGGMIRKLADYFTVDTSVLASNL